MFLFCKKIACYVYLSHGKNEYFVDQIQKNKKYCQSDMEESRVLSIKFQNIANFVDQAWKKSQNLSNRHEKITNFIDRAWKNHEFCLWCAEKFIILLICCGIIMCFISLLQEKNHECYKFATMKKYRFCQNQLRIMSLIWHRNLRILLIMGGKNTNFVNRAWNNDNF